MKKPLTIQHFLLFIVITLLSGCANESKNGSRLLDFAPEGTSIFINSNSMENLSRAIDHNVLLSEISKYSKLKGLKNQLQILKHFNIENRFLMCLSETNSDSLKFTIITKAKVGAITLDSISNASSETFTSKKEAITKTTINGQTLFSKMMDSVFIGSNDASIVEHADPKNTMDPDLERIYNSSSKEKSLSIILNLKTDGLKPSLFIDDALNHQQFSNYMLLDIDIAQDNLVMNGITKATDSTKSLIDVFKNTVPQENTIGRIAPNDVDYMLSFTYNNFKTLYNNLQQFNKNDSLAASTIFDNSVEIGLVQLKDQQAVALKSIDAAMTQEAFGSEDIVETFRDIPIYPFDRPEIFQRTVSPLIHYGLASKYMVLDDFFVFSDSVEFLKSIISNYQNNSTLSESKVFKNLMMDLSDASSIFVYNNASTLNAALNKNFEEQLNLEVEAYRASAIQFIYDTDFAHVNAAFKTYKSRGATNSVSEALDITLDAELLSAPQLFTNHTNNQKDIVAQDINNNLYLISNQGKIFWKKQLEGKVLGNIEHMDIYKNGRLQLVFATPHRVYVIDRNGKDVGAFPLQFRDDITQPLSLFDYDNNKNYRLLVTQGKSLLMYDRNGGLVKGFNFQSENSVITSQPKHFRIGKKDYIVFSQGKKLKILDRTGNLRINVKDDINFSENGIFLYNNNFTTTNDKGDLIQVDQKGQLSSSNLNLISEHFITSTGKTLVTLSENRLTIKSRTVELDYGDYSAPQIFYIKDKIYVATTDLQTKKIYLFDSLGKPIANFPVYGNSAIAMDNIDKDNNLEVVTKGDSNTIIVYEIN